MLLMNISGFGELKITDIIFDFNGTLAIEGILISGVQEEIQRLSQLVTVHVVTGNSYDTAENQLKDLNCIYAIMPVENQGKSKMTYLQQLNAETTLMVGNGRNDQYVLRAARIGIVIIGNEGAAIEAVLAADVVCNDIFDVFAMINNPKRLISTLRS